MAVSNLFFTILDRCEFSSHMRGAVATHRSEIETRLKSRLEVAKVEIVGSLARGSAIHQTSDLDMLTVLRNTEWTRGGTRMNSSTVLGKIRTELLGRYPSTAIGRDGQAVVVTFSDQTRVDVVPAGWIRAQQDGWPLYIIPDGLGGWRETAPDSHGRYIADADGRSGGKLKNVARIFRYWRWSRAQPVPVSAFHVEMLLASEGICGVGMTYQQCFAGLLRRLDQRDCRALQDPLGISGSIAACASEAKRTQAMQTISASASRALAALAAEHTGAMAEARRLWDIVFNGAFPR